MRPITRSMRKNIFREIRSSLGRFIAIFAISALGAGFYAGLKATSPDMRATADTYYDDQHLADFTLLSTYGFTQDDVDLLSGMEDVEDVMAGWGMDLLVETPEGADAVHFSALPADTGADNATYLNRLTLEAGRLPEGPNEVAVDSLAALSVGDEIVLSAENDEDSLEMMTQRRFTVVGRVRSPGYIAIMRGYTNIGSGRISYFAYTVPDAFDTEVYTELLLTASSARGVSSFSSEYDAAIDSLNDELEGFGTERAQVRYDELYDEGSTELADAKQELADAKQEVADAKQEIADAKQEIADAQQKLANAWQEIQDAETEIADGWTEYYENKQKLEDAEAQLASGEAELASALALLQEQQAVYDGEVQNYHDQYALYETQKGQVDALTAAVGGINPALAEMQTLLAADYGNPASATPGAWDDAANEQAFMAHYGAVVGTVDGVAAFLSENGNTDGAGALSGITGGAAAALSAGQYDVAWGTLSGGLTAPLPGAGLSGMDIINSALSGAADALADAKTQLDDGWVLLEDGKAQLDAGWAEYNTGAAQLATARAEVEDGRRQLADAYVTLTDARKELADAKITYYDEKAKADAEIADAEAEIADGEVEIADAEVKIADGEAEIADGEQALADLSLPEWFIRTRDDNPGYSGFYSDTTRIDAISAVIPVFFFLVAALVCLTSMTRMVEEQRTLIGTFKALGFTRSQVAAKFVLYAGLASAVGAALGVVIGFIVFPVAIWEAYSMLYVMPDISLFNSLWLAVASVAAIVLCTVVSTMAACLGELRSAPASLMRPKAPRAGKRVLLERIGPLWRRLPFMQKVTVRNLFRYKKRFFMTVIGVAGCTALLLTGFGLRDSISGIVPRQYGDINTYHMMASLTEASGADENTGLNELLPGIGQGLYVSETLVDAESENGDSSSMTVYIFVPEDPAVLTDYIHLGNRESGEDIPFPADGGGVVMTEKLATRLEVAVGDSVEVRRVNENPVRVPVAAVTENYIFNYIYMTPEMYGELFHEAPEYDTVLLNLNEEALASQNAVLNSLLGAEPVAGAVDVAGMQDEFEDMFESLNAVVWLIIAAAALLAFVVLYNLTNINITERSREIATLKVLGFHNREVASYVYRENVILTLIGTLVGLVLGVFLHDFVIVTAEVDEVMFRRTVEPLSYLWSVLFTIACGMVVNLVMMRRLRKINMVESLKSIE